jgi:hypothetical protein
MRRIIAFLPLRLAVSLPKSAGGREVLRCLAGATDAPPCLRSEWLQEGAARGNLTLAEAASLLAGLSPLLREDNLADGAGTAAIAIFRLLGKRIAEAARHPDFAALRILRVGDGSGRPRYVTLAELADASDERRLFRDSPHVQRFLRVLSEAAPDANALVLGGDAARQLAEIGAPFEFADAWTETFARVVETATEFGPSSARAKLLDLVFSEARLALPRNSCPSPGPSNILMPR